MKNATRRITTSVLTAGCLLLLMACGGDSTGGTTGPEFPSVTGTYSGTWTLTVTNQNNGQSASATCPGSVTIASQNSGDISGSYRIDSGGDCDTNASGSIEGSVRTDGGVNFALGGGSGSSGEFEDATGCVVTSGDSQLSGNITGGQMSVDATFFSDCPDGQGGSFPAKWVFEFSGS